jgi:hypothetical protein
MLRAVSSDAFFIVAVFFETLAALSLLQSVQAIALPEAFEPVLAFYRTGALPFLAPGAAFFAASAPKWLPDASIIASVFFFLFFIKQARRAMAPYGDGDLIEDLGSDAPDRSEAFVDWVLPPAACAAGAILTAPTMLPFLTLPTALFLTARRLAGFSSWFDLSRSFYVNLLCLGAAVGAAFSLLR